MDCEAGVISLGSNQQLYCWIPLNPTHLTFKWTLMQYKGFWELQLLMLNRVLFVVIDLWTTLASVSNLYSLGNICWQYNWQQCPRNIVYPRVDILQCLAFLIKQQWNMMDKVWTFGLLTLYSNANLISVHPLVENYLWFPIICLTSGNRSNFKRYNFKSTGCDRCLESY